MKRSVGLACLAIVGCLSIAWAPALGDPGSSTTFNSESATDLAGFHAPRTAAPVVLLADLKSKRVLIGREPNKHHAIGSITKLMTSLLAVRHLKMSHVVTISKRAASVGGSSMYLVAGDRVPVLSLLYGMLLPSGNDAAEAVAETISGNDKSFATLMNAQAKRFGLRCSHFVTPNGLDAHGEYSCASDVLKLSLLALSNPLIAKIIKTPSTAVPGATPGLSYSLLSTNELLTTYPGTIGVKTGTTDQAGSSISAAVKHGGHILVAVVLGSTEWQRYPDAESVLHYGFQDFSWPRTSFTMWSTASLEHHRAPKEAPIARWKRGWIDVNSHGALSTSLSG
jgi:D-alanyl-D-alanine carboxypeptidase (penicillin-binding protein 5/6)